jgi:AcrR family transcriptional regulator
MTAVAEQAGERMRMQVHMAAVRERRNGLHRLHAIGRGYLQWAQRHRAHFRIASARDQLDIDTSLPVRHNIQQVRELTEAQVRAAQAQGGISHDIDARGLALLARATVDGLARMPLDGHFPQGDVPVERIETQMAESLDLLLTLMGAPASHVKMPSTSRGPAPGTRKT